MHPCGPFHPAELDEAQKRSGAEQKRQGGEQKGKCKAATPSPQLESIPERQQVKQRKNWTFKKKKNLVEIQQSVTSYDCGQVSLPL